MVLIFLQTLAGMIFSNKRETIQPTTHQQEASIPLLITVPIYYYIYPSCNSDNPGDIIIRGRLGEFCHNVYNKLLKPCDLDTKLHLELLSLIGESLDMNYNISVRYLLFIPQKQTLILSIFLIIVSSKSCS